MNFLRSFPSPRRRRAFLVQTVTLGVALGLPFACVPGERVFIPTDELGGAAGAINSGGAPASVGGSPTSGGNGTTGGAGPSSGGSPATGGAGPTTGGAGPTGGSGGGSNTGPCEDHECLNGGQCLPDGETDYTCDCTGTGYTDEFCETEINECDPNPCEQSADCTDLIADYSCDCPLEFAGKDCSLAAFEVVDEPITAMDLSPDGSVLVGSSNFTASRYADGTLSDLGTYLDDTRSEAWSASTNGAVIVGVSEHHLNYTRRAVIWESGTIVELSPPAGHSDCIATGVTPDGQLITGMCEVTGTYDASLVRWVNREPELIPFPGDPIWCFESFPTLDGETVFGVCSSSGLTQPMRWTAAGGSALLVAGEPTCRIQGSNTDGSMGVGFCSPGGNSAQGFVWTPSGGFAQMTDDWLFDPTHNITAANDVSADGQFIVGETGYAGNVNGVVWDETRTPRMAVDVIEQALQTTIVDWSGFQDVNHISADGTVIVGTGYYTPSATYRNFIFRRNE